MPLLRLSFTNNSLIMCRFRALIKMAGFHTFLFAVLHIRPSTCKWEHPKDRPSWCSYMSRKIHYCIFTVEFHILRLYMYLKDEMMCYFHCQIDWRKTSWMSHRKGKKVQGPWLYMLWQKSHSISSVLLHQCTYGQQDLATACVILSVYWKL